MDNMTAQENEATAVLKEAHDIWTRAKDARITAQETEANALAVLEYAQILVQEIIA